MWKYWSAAEDDLSVLSPESPVPGPAPPPPFPTPTHAPSDAGHPAASSGSESAASQDEGEESEQASSAAPPPHQQGQPWQLPPAVRHFTPQVEQWLRDQCASLGCPKVSYTFAAPPPPPPPATATTHDDTRGDSPPRKRARGDGGCDNTSCASSEDEPPTPPCVLCRSSEKGGRCAYTGCRHIASSDVSDSRIVIDRSVIQHFEGCGTAGDVSQFRDLTGSLPVSGRGGSPFGAVHRTPHEGNWARCLYSLRLRGCESNALVPPALASLATPPVSTDCCGGAASHCQPVPLTLSSDKPLLASAATCVALTKLAFFSLPEDTISEPDIPLLASAIRARYPDTALFHKVVGGVCLFCACGLGSAYAVSWCRSAVFLSVPRVPSCVNVVGIGEATSCGIATSMGIPARAQAAHQWEVFEGGAWQALHPSDCHAIDAHLRRGLDRAVVTPLARFSGSVFKVDLLQSRATCLNTAITSPLRRTEVMVEDIRPGDMVKTVSESDGLSLGEAGEVVSVSGSLCGVRVKSGGDDEGMSHSVEAGALRRLDLRELDRRLRESQPGVRIAIFGSPSHSAKARDAVVAQCAYERATLFLPKGLGRVVQGAQRDIRQCTQVARVDVLESSVILTGTSGQLGSAQKMVSALLQQYHVNLQKELLGNAKAAAARRLTETRQEVPLHCGLREAVRQMQSFTGTKRKSEDKDLRNKLSRLKRREEDYMREGMIMFASLDDFSVAVQNSVSSAVAAAPGWDPAFLMLGLCPTSSVTLRQESTRIHSGDSIRIKPASLKARYRWSSVGPDDKGVVVGSEENMVRVDFPSHKGMTVFSSDIEALPKQRVYGVGGVQIALQDEGAMIQFGKSVVRWITSVFEGAANTGRPTCVVAEFSSGRHSQQLVCPNTSQLVAQDVPPSSEASIHTRLLDLARRLVQLKWHSLCDTFLSNEVFEVVHSAATAQRAIDVLSTIAAGNTASCSELAAQLAGLKSECESQSVEPVSKESEVVFTDTDGDTNQLALLGTSLFYTPIGKERSEVRSIHYDPAGGELSVCAGQDWRMQVDLRTGVLPRIVRLVCRSGIEHNMQEIASPATAIDALLQRLDGLQREWHASLTGAVSELQRQLQDLRVETSGICSQQQQQQGTLWAMKERVEAISGAQFDVEGGTLGGTPAKVLAADALLRRELRGFGATNVAVYQLGPQLRDALLDNHGFLQGLMKASTGVTSASVNLDELTLVGPPGSIEQMSRQLCLGNADLVFRSGPDTQAPDHAPPARCCPGEDARIALSCGHAVHPACVLRGSGSGTRCPVCRALLRINEIKQALPPAEVLPALSEQVQQAYLEDPRMRRCDCGEWVAAGDDTQVAVCLRCSRVAKAAQIPTGPDGRHVLHARPDSAACWSCWGPLSGEARVCTEGCAGGVSCASCGCCPLDSRHAVAAVRLAESSEPLAPRCLAGHPLAPVGKQVCSCCRAQTRSAYACEVCCLTTCLHCAVAPHLQLSYCDAALLEGLGLQRSGKAGPDPYQEAPDFAGAMSVTGPSASQPALHFVFLVTEATPGSVPPHLVPNIKAPRMRAGIMGRGLHPALFAQLVGA